MKSIHILVSPTGEVLLATKGFTDDACRDASRALEKALGIITQEFASNLKSEVMRLVGEKMKEAAKAQDKSIHEIRELVLEKA